MTYAYNMNEFDKKKCFKNQIPIISGFSKQFEFLISSAALCAILNQNGEKYTYWEFQVLVNNSVYNIELSLKFPIGNSLQRSAAIQLVSSLNFSI